MHSYVARVGRPIRYVLRLSYQRPQYQAHQYLVLPQYLSSIVCSWQTYLVACPSPRRPLCKILHQNVFRTQYHTSNAHILSQYISSNSKPARTKSASSILPRYPRQTATLAAVLNVSGRPSPSLSSLPPSIPINRSSALSYRPLSL